MGLTDLGAEEARTDGLGKEGLRGDRLARASMLLLRELMTEYSAATKKALPRISKILVRSRVPASVSIGASVSG